MSGRGSTRAYELFFLGSRVGDSLDPGLEECLAAAAASENIVSAAEALMRVSEELKIREILQEERAVNEEVAASKKRFVQAQAEVDAVVLAVRRQCKDAIQELMAEIQRC